MIKPYLLLLKIVLATFLGTILFVGGCQHGEADYKAKYEKERAEHIAEKAAAKQEAARLEEKWQKDADAALAQHKKDLKDAETESKRVTSSIIAGNLRLRKQWTCQAPAAEGGRVSDEGAQLRAEDIGRIYGIGKEADAQIRALQTTLKAEREQ